MGLSQERIVSGLDCLTRFGIVPIHQSSKTQHAAHGPWKLELLPQSEDMALLNIPSGQDALGAAVWIEEALRSSRCVSVQRVPGSGSVIIVPATFLDSRAPPLGTVIERPWATLRLPRGKSKVDAFPPIAQLAVLGDILQAAGVPWRTVSYGKKEARLLLHCRDLQAGVTALVFAGHAVTSVDRGCTALAGLPGSVQRSPQDIPGSGVWILMHYENFADSTIWDLGDPQKVPLRIQTLNGIYAEIHLPNTITSRRVDNICGHVSSTGHFTTVTDMGRKVSVRHALVDFQPRSARSLRQLVRCATDVMEVIGLPPSNHREVWRRVGSTNDCVALKLVADSRNRTGIWLFTRFQFARIIGLQNGDGVIAGTCCRSLEQLILHFDAADVETELRTYYEAIDGEVEAMGQLRVSRDVWHNRCTGSFLYKSDDPSVGGAAQLLFENGKVSKVMLRLPDGNQEVWQVLEWSFDPFNSSIAAGNAQRADSCKKPWPTNVSSTSTSSKSSASKSAKPLEGRTTATRRNVKKRSSSCVTTTTRQDKSKRNHRSSSRSVSVGKSRKSLAGVAIPPPNGMQSSSSVAIPPPISIACTGRAIPDNMLASPIASTPNAGSQMVRNMQSQPILSSTEPAAVGVGMPGSNRATMETSLFPFGASARTGVPSSVGPPNLLAAALREYLAQNFSQGVDEAAAQALFSAPRDVQQKILMDKFIPYQAGENPSAVLIASIRRASNVGPDFEAVGHDVLANWAAQNQLDGSALAAMRALPIALQQKVMDMGPVLGVNSSAIVMGRIRLARMS